MVRIKAYRRIFSCFEKAFISARLRDTAAPQSASTIDRHPFTNANGCN